MNDLDLTLIDDTEPEQPAIIEEQHEEYCDCCYCLRENMHYYFGGGL